MSPLLPWGNSKCNPGSLSGPLPCTCQFLSLAVHFLGNCPSVCSAWPLCFLLFPSLSYFWAQIPPTCLCLGEVFLPLGSSPWLIPFCQEHCLTGTNSWQHPRQTPAETCLEPQAESRACTVSGAPFASWNEPILLETAVRGSSSQVILLFKRNSESLEHLLFQTCWHGHLGMRQVQWRVWYFQILLSARTILVSGEYCTW